MKRMHVHVSVCNIDKRHRGLFRPVCGKTGPVVKGDCAGVDAPDDPRMNFAASRHAVADCLASITLKAWAASVCAGARRNSQGSIRALERGGRRCHRARCYCLLLR